MNQCTLFFLLLYLLFLATHHCVFPFFLFFLYQQSKESNVMFAIGTGDPIFALASLCRCSRNFKLLV